MRLIDLTGKIFGKLTVIERDFSKKSKQTYWICLYECGNTTSVTGGSLTTGNTKSCKCYRDTRKGLTTKDRRLYSVWSLMRHRCYNINNKDYKSYGARGIIIDEIWSDYINFYNWALENGYQDHLTIERIDINGNYCPNNCTWIPKSEQANNKQASHFVTIFNETKTVKDWGLDERCLVRLSTFRQRVNNGWPPEIALSHPLLKNKNSKRLF